MSKISDLPSGGSLQATDYLIAVRSGSNVKVQPDSINFSQVDLADSAVLQFGDSQDLTIVHNTFNSVINQAGTGNLLIQKAGATKLTINASGIDVTGSVTASADVTISNGNNRFVASSTSAGDYVRIYGGSGTGKWDIYGNGANLRIGDNESAGLVQIDTNLYTVGSVGIGTSSPASGKNFVVSNSGAEGVEYEVGVIPNYNQILHYNRSTSTYVTNAQYAATHDWHIQGDLKMTLDASGNVGIGASAGERLTVSATNPTDGLVASLRNIGTSGLTGTKLWFNQNTVDNWNIGQPAGVNAFVFCNSTGSTLERMRIDGATGNVGIGVVPLAHHYKSLEIGNTGSQITGRTAADTYIMSGVYWSGASTQKYAVSSVPVGSYNITNGVHIWSNAPADTAGNVATMTAAMVLDASGNLLVGKTAADGGVNGGEIRSNGEAYLTATSTPLALNRKSTDGALLNFAKDGVSVGSIGVSGGNNLYISGLAVDHSGLTFATNQILPSAVGAITDGAESLGSTSNRFKDLHLSGGAYLGGTLAANKLDDYETGTFTPTLFGSGSSATTLLTALGRYVKVGKSVTCWIEISCNGSTTLPTGNYISLAGLPFSPVSSRAFTAVVSITGLTGLAAGTYFVGITNSGTSVNLNKYNQDGIVGSVGLTAGSLTSTFSASTTITYEVA